MLNSFLRLLTRCYRMALPYGRLKLFGLLGLILFNGLLQLVGVTSVFPFFALATDPGRLQQGAALTATNPAIVTQNGQPKSCYGLPLLRNNKFPPYSRKADPTTRPAWPRVSRSGGLT